ncbi:MAG: hypothetical protein A2Y81_08450 [Nitrospirae bacterium RBG_13_43_8]|nr:MAG: hypothetical protein A2Y81_08450 [Nitrospirae bacterium RBG_13_43_8]
MRRPKDIRLTVSIFIIIVLGLFLPKMSIAGPLEPSEPPGPTMHTLDELYNKPLWNMLDKVFADWPANPRFAVCDNGTPETSDDMVLDKETGLVWERDPSAKTSYETLPLDWALLVCNQMEWYSSLGRPDGWRLPTLQELASLIDRTHYYPVLPSGHPFLNVNMEDYY